MLRQQSIGLRARPEAKQVRVILPTTRKGLLVRCSAQQSQSSWLQRIGAAVLATGIVLVPGMTVHPAQAVTSITHSSQASQAEELAEIIRQRTGSLPKATLPPSPMEFDAAPRLEVANAIASSANVQNLKQQLDALTAKLAEEAAQRDAQRNAISRLESELQQERQREAEAQAKAQAASAAAAQAKAEAQAAAAEREAASSVAKAARAEAAAALQAATSPASASAPEVVTKTVVIEREADEEEGAGGQALGLLNALGLVVGGGLGGYVFVLNNKKKASEEELSSALSGERAAVNELKKKAAEVTASLEAEQQLVAKIKRDMQLQAETNARLVEAERREKEASQRASDMVSKALEAEKKLATAVRAEAAAAQEATNAERAAKFVAEAEAKAVTEQLKRAEDALAAERELTKKVGADALRMKEAMKEAEASMGSQVVNSEKMKQSLDLDIVTANNTVAEQQRMLEKVGKEALDMREAMRSLKASSADIAVKAQKEAEAAAQARQALETDLAKLNAMLDEEKQAAESAREEARGLKQSLTESQMALANTQEQLAAAKEVNNQLMAKVSELQSRIQQTETALAEERNTSKELRSEAQGLKSQLAEVKGQLSQTVMTMQAEKARKDALVADLNKAQQQVATTSTALENEKGTTAALRREAEMLKRQIADLQTAGVEMRAQMSDLNNTFTKRLSAAATEADQAKAAKMAVEIKYTSLVADLDKARQQLVDLEAANKKGATANQLLQQEIQQTKNKISALEVESKRQNEEISAKLTAQLQAVQLRLANAEVEASRVATQRDEQIAQSTRELEIVRGETAQAQQAAGQALADLASERAAREGAETTAKQLRAQLDVLLKSTQTQQEEADAQFITLRNSLEAVKAKQAAKARRAESPAGGQGAKGQGFGAPSEKRGEPVVVGVSRGQSKSKGAQKRPAGPTGADNTASSNGAPTEK